MGYPFLLSPPPKQNKGLSIIAIGMLIGVILVGYTIDKQMTNKTPPFTIELTEDGQLTEHEKQQLAKVLSDLEAIGIEKIEAITKQGLKFAGIDENDFKAPEHAFVARLSEPDQARYLLLLVEWVRTGERKAVERFRAKHGHPDP